MSRALVVALLLLCALAARAADVPYLSGRVVDNAEILKPATRAALAAKLKAHEDATTNQVVVLTQRTIGGGSIEEFATAVFDAWKLGQKGKDNGVLVIVVPDDRRMRIEVGYGLEGQLTDAQASRIIRNVMTPAFKSNDYDGGISAGVDAVLAVLDGRDAPADTPQAASAKSARSFMDESSINLPPWPMRILLGAFIFGIIGLFTVIGVMTPGMGWFLYLFYGCVLFSGLYYPYHLGYGAALAEAGGVGQNLSASGGDYLAAVRMEEEAHHSRPIAEMNKDELLEFMKAPASISGGEAVFKANCVACHGDQGQGIVGPNLTDNYWLHGGSPESILASVTHG